MPSLSLSGGKGKFTWQIRDLSSAFATGSYIKAGITKYQFTQEASSISGIVDSVSAWAGNTSKNTPSREVTYSPGTYTFWGWTQAGNGKYYPLSGGSATVTVQEETTTYTIKATLKFSANGGSGAPSDITKSDTRTTSDGYLTFSIPYTTPTRNGYAFEGWEFNGTTYSPGGSITLYATTSGQTWTMYAVWKKKGATPYIYYNRQWRSATAYIYQNGVWREASSRIYQNGWKPD